MLVKNKQAPGTVWVTTMFVQLHLTEDEVHTNYLQHHYCQRYVGFSQANSIFSNWCLIRSLFSLINWLSYPYSSVKLLGISHLYVQCLFLINGNVIWWILEYPHQVADHSLSRLLSFSQTESVPVQYSHVSGNQFVENMTLKIRLNSRIDFTW